MLLKIESLTVYGPPGKRCDLKRGERMTVISFVYLSKVIGAHLWSGKRYESIITTYS